MYRARSPIHFVDLLSCPVILFQGLEDEVVPPAQAEIMVEALEAKGLPYAYLPFEGEQHGFRKAENIRGRLRGRAVSFYAQVLRLRAGDPIPNRSRSATCLRRGRGEPGVPGPPPERGRDLLVGPNASDGG